MTNLDFQKPTAPNSESTSTMGELPIVSKKLVIFDFDDTLFCTKYFDTFSLSYQDIFSFKTSLEEINLCLFKELIELEKTIIELFSKLEMNNYDIVIISNADMKWINNCLTHFLEEFKEYINENKIKIFSAKNLFSGLNKNNDCSEWKENCFKKVIGEMYFSTISETSVNLDVISIGDGIDEKKAVFKLNKNNFDSCQNLTKKFIRMISNPSAGSIIKQLEFLQENIENILNNENHNFKMVIELVNGCSKVNCVPKKIKNFHKKENKLKKRENCNNYSDKTDFLLFEKIDKYNEEENEEIFRIYFQEDNDINRNNLFLGKKIVNL